VEASFQAHVERPGGRRKAGSYGYQFWLWDDTISNKPTPIVACVGNGDQRIFFDKTHDLVVVITAGNYNKWDIEKNSYALMKEYIYPALVK
jgi:CubicO group peptidase (beta-lactamase class C family)